eukprot:1258340-Lingulodinium_polyedra.AAC.1
MLDLSALCNEGAPAQTIAGVATPLLGWDLCGTQMSWIRQSFADAGPPQPQIAGPARMNCP